MRHKFISTSILLLTIFTLITTSYLYLLTPPTAASESVGDYFSISYTPATFSKPNIISNEPFSVTINGNATCVDDLHITVRKVRVTGCISAEHTATGNKVTLNPSYTIYVETQLRYPGDTVNISVTAPLHFPTSGEAGQYSVIAKTVKAEVYFLGNWSDITEMVPASVVLGSVYYATAGTTSTPTPTPTPTPTTPTVTATPTATATLNTTTSPTVTATPGASITPSASPSTTATRTTIATPRPTSTVTANVSSLTPDGSTSPARYGAPVWAAIGLIATLILAIIILAIMRMQTRSKHAVKSDENQPEGDNNKQ